MKAPGGLGAQAFQLANRAAQPSTQFQVEVVSAEKIRHVDLLSMSTIASG